MRECAVGSSARAGLDVLRLRAGEPADARGAQLGSDLAHGCEIALRRDRETRLDDVDAEFFQRVRHAQLLRPAHGEAGRLLPVAQGRVEDQHAPVGHVGFAVDVFAAHVDLLFLTEKCGHGWPLVDRPEPKPRHASQPSRPRRFPMDRGNKPIKNPHPFPGAGLLGIS